jgi:hypothetical protein
LIGRAIGLVVTKNPKSRDQRGRCVFRNRHPGEKQLEEFLESTEPYVATTRGREYQRLVSRATGLNAIVRSIINAWSPPGW